MPRQLRSLTLLLLILLLGLAACSQEEHPQSAVTVKAKAPEKKAARVVIPEAVQGHWKAVRIAVLDKETRQETVYTVDIGYEFAVGDGSLRVKVKNFLPAFVMDGTVMTSESNATKNPAAQVVISEDGKPAFSGWLFSLYPSAHAFQHPRYNFLLVDFVPSPGKKS